MKLAKATLATAAGALVWAGAIERQLFTLRRHEVVVLPAGAPPLRVLQLSDLHLAPWQRRKMAWVRALRALNPDLLVLTGDLLGHQKAIAPLCDTLSGFADIPTVFVHGSNDYFGPRLKNPARYLLAPTRKITRVPDLDTAQLERNFAELGFINLNNNAAQMQLAGTAVELYGLGDPHIKYDSAEQMLHARNALPAKHADLRIGVVHAPYRAALDTLLGAGSQLLLAGHTHGGQLRLPGVGALTSNCDLPLRQARGLSVWFDAERAAYLQVSAGVGTSIYAPLRFACRPEATLLTLSDGH